MIEDIENCCTVDRNEFHVLKTETDDKDNIDVWQGLKRVTPSPSSREVEYYWSLLKRGKKPQKRMRMCLSWDAYQAIVRWKNEKNSSAWDVQDGWTLFCTLLHFIRIKTKHFFIMKQTKSNMEQFRVFFIFESKHFWYLHFNY